LVSEQMSNRQTATVFPGFGGARMRGILST
jgi:hypothetical protein